jgi:Leu/Phe-tRNA-protein transferase
MHRATDDRFLLLIEADDPMFDAQLASEHLKNAGAEEVEVVIG